jgi:hypothetical protein
VCWNEQSGIYAVAGFFVVSGWAWVRWLVSTPGAVDLSCMLKKQVRLQWFEHCCRALGLLEGVVLLAGMRIWAWMHHTGGKGLVESQAVAQCG